MKFTKGEWVLKMTGDGKAILINEGYIGLVHSDDIDGDEAWANAKLIAAAPYLLSCLQYALSDLEALKELALKGKPGEFTLGMCRRMDSYESAIKKAIE